MVSAYLALGTELQIETEPDNFETIPGCQSLAGPGATREAVDVTSHSSTGGYREFISGLRDGGEITCDINWLFDDDVQNVLETAFDADEPYAFRVRYPWLTPVLYDAFDGLVTDLTSASPIDAQATRSLTVKITGPVERTEET